MTGESSLTREKVAETSRKDTDWDDEAWGLSEGEGIGVDEGESKLREAWAFKEGLVMLIPMLPRSLSNSSSLMKSTSKDSWLSEGEPGASFSTASFALDKEVEEAESEAAEGGPLVVT